MMSARASFHGRRIADHWRYLICSCGIAAASWGQLGVALKADRHNYVKYEPVKISLTLRNYTGNLLEFGAGGDGAGGVLMTLAREDDPITQTKSIAELFEPFRLSAGETRELTFPLNRVFNLQKSGGYTVYAQATHPRLRQDYRSKPVTFGVREGSVLGRRKFGLPVANVSADIPSRTLTLLRVQEREGEQLCMQIEDDEAVYAVVRLGKQIFGAEPQCDIDAVSNIHLLMRLKSRLFSYRVFGPDGKLKQRTFHMLDETSPMLIRDQATGLVSVTGGRPAVEGTDYVITDGDEVVR